MRTSDFIIFISIVLVIYGSVHAYLFARGWQAIPASPAPRIIYSVIFVFLGLTYIAGRITEKISVCAFSDVLIWIGSFWLGMILYLLLFALLFDIIRLINSLSAFYPPAVADHYAGAKLAAFAFTIGASLIIVAAGHFNSIHPRITEMRLSIPKKAGPFRNLTIAYASDIHLGTIISNSRLDTLVSGLNSCDPDIVLLGGDIVDEDLKPVIENDMGEQLKRIKAPYGIYAVTGNHEYIGGAEAACRFMKDHGITVLRDTYVVIEKTVVLAGRDDLSKNRFSGVGRKMLDAILDGVDRKYPIILMDHQPFLLEESMNSGVDLHLAGHTHAGQLWPFNFIIKAMYRLGWGYAKFGNTHFYVSTGFGTWGPPVRTGNRPEIVKLVIDFRE